MTGLTDREKSSLQGGAERGSTTGPVGCENARLGATLAGADECGFLVWAPLARTVELHLHGDRERRVPMERLDRGYFTAVEKDVRAGSLYTFLLDGEKERPDPASRFQPHGVHEASGVVARDFPWSDRGWRGLPLADCAFYELHVGTFTPAGTFQAVIPELRRLRDLGITALELMPVAQFPGGRNWGYDGTYPFAVQNSYGGPDGLRALVDACHAQGMALVLDVVYNHLGPEGNYLRDFGPYFTSRCRTPWGEAVNFDGPESDEVRRYFIENALCWIEEFHADGLRLDAIHSIFDQSPAPFLQELSAAVHERALRLRRPVHLIAESNLNDPRVVRPSAEGGIGLDAQWNDDFHHALHTTLLSERSGYYVDYGGFPDLAASWREGYVYQGRYSAYRRRRHGNSSRDIPPEKLVVFTQNHDQIGNRLFGERMSGPVSADDLKLAAAAVLLSPYLPLLFMGEEYGETAPFQYFVSHLDPELIEAVRRGRVSEFASFAWQSEPPDPQDEATFLRCKLDPSLRERPEHRALEDWYRELFHLRRRRTETFGPSHRPEEILAFEESQVLFVRYAAGAQGLFHVFAFAPLAVRVDVPVPAGEWRLLLSSHEAAPPRLRAEGAISLQAEARSVVTYGRERDG